MFLVILKISAMFLKVCIVLGMGTKFSLDFLLTE